MTANVYIECEGTIYAVGLETVISQRCKKKKKKVLLKNSIKEPQRLQKLQFVDQVMENSS